MFGVNKKIYFIISAISMGLGLITLILFLAKVLADIVFLLISLIFILLSIALVLRPIAKQMKRKTDIYLEYRSKLYTIVTSDCPRKKIDISSVTFYQTEDNFLKYISRKEEELVFNTITFEEACEVVKALLTDFVKIVYGVVDDETKKIIKSRIMTFEIHIVMLDKKVYTYELIEDYLFVKF